MPGASQDVCRRVSPIDRIVEGLKKVFGGGGVDSKDQGAESPGRISSSREGKSAEFARTGGMPER